MSEKSNSFTGAFKSLVSGIQKIVDKLDDFINWFFDLVPNFFKSMWVMLQDVFLWCFEQILSLVTKILDGITGFDSIISQISSVWSGIPADVMNIMGVIGLGTALGIISAAILIRLALQLIPFVRLGS